MNDLENLHPTRKRKRKTPSLFWPSDSEDEEPPTKKLRNRRGKSVELPKVRKRSRSQLKRRKRRLATTKKLTVWIYIHCGSVLQQKLKNLQWSWLCTIMQRRIPLHAPPVDVGFECQQVLCNLKVSLVARDHQASMPMSIGHFDICNKQTKSPLRVEQLFPTQKIASQGKTSFFFHRSLLVKQVNKLPSGLHSQSTIQQHFPEKDSERERERKTMERRGGKKSLSRIMKWFNWLTSCREMFHVWNFILGHTLESLLLLFFISYLNHTRQ